MRLSKVFIMGTFAVLLISPLGISSGVDRPDIAPEGMSALATSLTEAPTGFDNLTNGLMNQATFDADRAVFEELETIADGLGPVYNARSHGPAGHHHQRRSL
jgi:hypothetical protein